MVVFWAVKQEVLLCFVTVAARRAACTLCSFDSVEVGV